MKRRQARSAGPLDEAALYDYAVKALGRRMRTVREIERLLRPRVEPDASGEAKVAAVVARLKTQRYLDDSAYAMTYARLRRENEGFGRYRVERDMTRKGIATGEAHAALDATYEGSDEEQLARRFLARKRLTEPHTPAETARILRRLVAAGFSYSTITAVLKSWNIDVDETDLPSPD